MLYVSLQHISESEWDWDSFQNEVFEYKKTEKQETEKSERSR